MPRLSRSHCTSEPGDGDRPLQRVARGLVAAPVGDGRDQAVAGAHDVGAGVRRAGSCRCRRCSWTRPRRTPPDRRSPPAGRRGCRRSAVRRPRRAAPPRRRPRTTSGSSGIIDRGMPHTSSSSSDQSRVRRSMSRVRLALVTSVTWMPPRRPPVRFHTTQVSGVPKSSSPASAAARAPGDVVEDPRDLGRREVGREREPGQLGEPRRAPVRCGGELVDPRLRAGVLPDQGVVDGMPGAPVPHHRRLALIGHADAGDIARAEAGPRQRGGGHPLDVRPDLDRVVLDPAGALHDLLVLALRDRDDGP